MGNWLLATSYRQSEFKIRNSRLESVINGQLVAIYQLPHARSQMPDAARQKPEASIICYFAVSYLQIL